MRRLGTVQGPYRSLPHSFHPERASAAPCGSCLSLAAKFPGFRVRPHRRTNTPAGARFLRCLRQLVGRDLVRRSVGAPAAWLGAGAWELRLLGWGPGRGNPGCWVVGPGRGSPGCWAGGPGHGCPGGWTGGVRRADYFIVPRSSFIGHHSTTFPAVIRPLRPTLSCLPPKGMAPASGRSSPFFCSGSSRSSGRTTPRSMAGLPFRRR